MSTHDLTASRELFHHTTSSCSVYDCATAPTIRALAKNIVRGTYKADAAVLAWERVAATAAKEYVREHGSAGDVWYRMFPLQVRRDAAQMLADYYKGSILDLAELTIGPPVVWVYLHDWDHDANGNPTAHHAVWTGPNVNDARLLVWESRRRAQVGYSSYRDSYARTAIGRAGFASRWYVLESAQIDRYDISVLTYKRKPVTLV